ncbi:MAG TPA: hypothetical protein VM324_02770 [Egibacteraceae bacterium]|nr:hypothetical protein [Egibacteraceae bacterium]
MNIDTQARAASHALDESVAPVDPQRTLPAVRRRASAPRRSAVTAMSGIVLLAVAFVVGRDFIPPDVRLGGPSEPGLTFVRVLDPQLGRAGMDTMESAAVLGGRIVAVGAAGGSPGVWLSDDGGATWTRPPDAGGVLAHGGMLDVTVSGDEFVAVGQAGATGSVWTSVDGETWAHADLGLTVLPGETGAQQVAVSDGPAGPVAVGFTLRPGDGDEDTRTTAAAWAGGDPRGVWRRSELTLPTTDADSSMRGVTRSGAGLLAVGQVGGRHAVWESTDGAAWEALPVTGLQSGALLFGITAIDDRLLAYGTTAPEDGDAGMWWSADGRHWTAATHEALAGPGPQSVSSVFTDGQRLIAVGSDGERAAVWVGDASGARWDRADVESRDDGPSAATGAVLAADRVVVVGHAGQPPDRNAAVWLAPLERLPEPPPDGEPVHAPKADGEPPGTLMAHVWRDDAPGSGVFTVDARTGAIREVLLDDTEVGEGATAQDRSSEGVVYVSRIVTACLHEIVAVDVARRGQTPVASGTAPSVSPDGRFLAYAVPGGCGADPQVVVRDLTSGEETIWREASDPELLVVPGSLSWSPGGDRLAFHVVYEDGVELRVVDPSTPGGRFVDARRLQPADAAASWRLPVFRADGVLSVVETCCDLEAGEVRLVTLDLDTLEPVAESIRLPDVPAAIDADETGRHLLLTMSDGTLLRLDDGGDPAAVPVPGRVFGARW